MAVRRFTNIFVLLLILIVRSRDTLFLVCFTLKNVRTDRQWLLPNVNRQKMSPPINTPVKKYVYINGIRGDPFGYQRAKVTTRFINA